MEALTASGGFVSTGLIALCRKWFGQANKDFDTDFAKSLVEEQTVIHATVLNSERALASLLRHMELLVRDPDHEVPATHTPDANACAVLITAVL